MCLLRCVASRPVAGWLLSPTALATPHVTAAVFQTHASDYCRHCYRLRYSRRPVRCIISVKPARSEATWRLVCGIIHSRRLQLPNTVWARSMMHSIKACGSHSDVVIWLSHAVATDTRHLRQMDFYGRVLVSYTSTSIDVKYIPIQSFIASHVRCKCQPRR